MSETHTEVDNLHIISSELLPTPTELKQAMPLQGRALETVLEGHRAVKGILDGKDHRLIVVVGPCSIHDPAVAMDYARMLQPLAEELSDSLKIVMRVYFEKPRTTVGWEGLIYDPYLDGSHRIADGLKMGRQLMLDINDLGLPIGIEALDLISPQYLQDLVSWTAIGARTTESPTHRKLSSGISSAVGFKNSTDGSLTVAVNAIRAASAINTFISVTEDGKVAAFRTSGNPHCHVILRGGSEPNYEKQYVDACEKALEKAAIRPNIMIDCSHGNSRKQHELQLEVLDNVAEQIQAGNQSIIGVMVESHINAGNQPIPDDLDAIKYGVSITDACIDWPTTEAALRQLAERVGPALKKRHSAAKQG